MFFGWDVSTSIVGCSIFLEDGSFVKSCLVDLRDKEGPLEKADAFASAVVVLGVPGEPTMHFVEERLGGFSAGKTMQQTLLKLAAFNSVASYVIHREFAAPVVHIHTSTIKSVLAREFGLIVPRGSTRDEKKRATWDFVCDREPTFPKALNRNDNPAVGQFDMADAYVVGLVGISRQPREDKRDERDGKGRGDGRAGLRPRGG